MVQRWFAMYAIVHGQSLVPAHVHWRTQQPGHVAFFVRSLVNACVLPSVPCAVVVIVSKSSVARIAAVCVLSHVTQLRIHTCTQLERYSILQILQTTSYCTSDSICQPLMPALTCRDSPRNPAIGCHASPAPRCTSM